MRRRTWGQACIGLSALAFAGGAAAQSRGPGPFAGSFSVASNTTVSVTSPMAITEERTTRERLEIGQGSRADVNVQVTNDLGEHCTLTANRSGSAGLLFGAGQHCTFTDSVRNMRMNFTLRSGTGSVAGDSLSLSFSWNVASNGGFLSIAGSASQRSSGRRTGGRALADTNAAPSPEASPMPVSPTNPVAVVPAAQPAIVVAPMMPMTGTPTRSSSRHASSTTHPHATASAATPPTAVIPPTPVVPVAVQPSAPASAWGSPTAAPSAPASAWGSPTAAPLPTAGANDCATAPATTNGWTTPQSMPLPIDANTPGAIVHSSGWILGPLFSGVAAAVPMAAQAVNAWTAQAPAPPQPAGTAWGPQPGAVGNGWASGPGVVLGAPATNSPQGFGVTITPSPARPIASPVPPANPGGPGIVFGASR